MDNLAEICQFSAKVMFAYAFVAKHPVTSILVHVVSRKGTNVNATKANETKANETNANSFSANGSQ